MCLYTYRQLQDVHVHQVHGQEQVAHGTHYQTSRSTHQQDGSALPFVMELPNTLNYRLIAQHPHISCKLVDYAKSHGVELHFTETESNIQAVLSGTPEAIVDVQTNLSSLDRQLQAKLETRYQRFHCALLPLLLEPSVSRILAEIESKYHVEICVADSCGTVVSVKQFIQLLQSECVDKLLLTVDLRNIAVPDVHISTSYDWKLRNEEGRVIPLPDSVNQYLNRTFFIDKRNEAEFEFNGMHYTANMQWMCITEIESGQVMALDIEPLVPSWSYAISDEDFVQHEMHTSQDLENMFRYGGSFITLAGSKHTLDLYRMHQIDLETGHRVSVKRDPALVHHEVPQYFIIFAVRGLQKNLEPAVLAMQKRLRACCDTVSFVTELMPSIPRGWLEIIHIQMLNTVRQYCLKIGSSTLENGKSTIQLKGAKDILDKVQILLKEQSLELQHRVISQQQRQPTCQPRPNNYPSEWEPQKSDFELIDVHHRSSEWNSIEGRMKRSIQNVTIVQVQRIQNRQLWDKYALEMKHMSERNHGSVNERQLFHGTRKTDPKIIVKAVRGIDFRYSRRDYQLLWGTGAYFAVNASYSDKYCHIDSNSGMKQLLLVKVLTGNSRSYGERNDPNLTKPPPLSRGSHVLYDTVNGYTKGSYVYVVYDHDRAYPAYLITYFC